MVNFSIRHTKIRLYIGIVLHVVYFDWFEHIRGGLRNFLHIQWNDCWLLSVAFVDLPLFVFFMLSYPCLCLYILLICPLFMLIGPCLCCLLCWFSLVCVGLFCWFVLVCVCIFCWFSLVCVCWIALSCVVYMFDLPLFVLVHFVDLHLSVLFMLICPCLCQSILLICPRLRWYIF